MNVNVYAHSAATTIVQTARYFFVVYPFVDQRVLRVSFVVFVEMSQASNCLLCQTLRSANAFTLQLLQPANPARKSERSAAFVLCCFHVR